jgi:hypothetical protein
MTIAACHVSPEGVVLGADSATTLTAGPDGTCHLDYAQKVFEVGKPGSSVGLVTWGLGQIGQESHRTIAADLGYRHASKAFSSLDAMADDLASDLWGRYTSAYGEDIKKFKELDDKKNKGTASPQDLENRDFLLEAGSGGYCLAGRVTEHGPCRAFQVLWGVHMDQPHLMELAQESPVFWGVPMIMERLVFGCDSGMIALLLQSGKWSGTEQELVDITLKNRLMFPRLLPIREAIDWVHTVIHTTIRGTKFANWPHWCGGPVEIAAITTDRHFRWVRHKSLDAAILTAEEAKQ